MQFESLIHRTLPIFYAALLWLYFGNRLLKRKKKYREIIHMHMHIHDSPIIFRDLRTSYLLCVY
jgi:hypothetical protein